MSRIWLRAAGPLVATVLLAACARTPPVERLPPPRPGAVSSARPVIAPRPVTETPPAALLARSAPPLATMAGLATADLNSALAAFRASCPALTKRSDLSGLTAPVDWGAPCAAAATATDARAYFATAFTAVMIGDGRGLDTGYYEPDLGASLVAAPGLATPIFRRPPDLVDLDLGTFDAALAGKHVRGRVDGARFVPYFDRAAIDDGALVGRGLELAWASDPVAAFFLEIQGSGRLRLPDGTVLRVGYDGQNGHAYTGIGKLLRDRGALAPGQATMAGIVTWVRAHPAEGRALLRENRSKVFFKVLATPAAFGPPGAMGVPLTARVSVAVDPRSIPLGAPLWLDTIVAGAPFRTVVVAQDTGGAIKGMNRLDLFWGSGDAPGAVAGGITATGTVTLLLPPAAAARLLNHASAPPRP